MPENKRNYTIRPWRPDDKPQLTALWQTAFGDSPETISEFQRLFLREDTCLVAAEGDRVLSAMYIIPGQTLYPFRRNTLGAGYTYALATIPEARGLGIGSAVYKAANDAALRDADMACVLPAEPSLYPFYEAAAGAKPVSSMKEARFAKVEVSSLSTGMAALVPALQYAGMREELLGGMPHVTFPDEYFEFMESCGTGFFVLENGAAAVDMEDGVCRITELLDPGTDGMRSVASIAAWRPAEEYIVRSPVFYNGPGEIRPYMLGVMKAAPSYPMPDDLWWGFGLE